MFDLNLVPKRYFEFKVPGRDKVLHLEPPKLKTMKRLDEGKTVEEIAAVVAAVISQNRENWKATPDMVMEWMNQDQLTAFLKAYGSWLRKEKQNDPN